MIKPTKITAVERVDPLGDLTPEQAHEWRAVVNRLPVDWFPPETHSLLAQHCRHVVSATHVAGLIENLLASDDFSLDDFDRLLRMQEREGRALSSLATRMRITQQAQYSHRKKTGPLMRPPWKH